MPGFYLHEKPDEAELVEVEPDGADRVGKKLRFAVVLDGLRFGRAELVGAELTVVDVAEWSREGLVGWHVPGHWQKL